MRRIATKLGLGFSTLALGASLLVWNQVPNPMPIHWNAQGVADGFGPRWLGLTLMPAIGVATTLLVEGLTRPSMKSEGSHRALTSIVAGTTAFMAGLHGLMLHAALSPGFALSTGLLLVLMGGLFAMLGAVMPNLEQNRWAGVRTPWTLADELNWKLTHRFARWTFVVAGAVSMLAGLALRAPASFVIAIAAIAIGSVAPLVFSYAVHVVRSSR